MKTARLAMRAGPVILGRKVSTLLDFFPVVDTLLRLFARIFQSVKITGNLDDLRDDKSGQQA